MKKQYTKKQIVETIKHWQNVLKSMNESNNALLVACLCHEMIHYYDRLFGEYCDFTKYTMMTGTIIDTHNTMTFETMKDNANDLGVKVIQTIPRGKTAEILDKEGIELLFKKAKEEGLVLEDENQRQLSSVGGITMFNDRLGGSINIF